MRMSAVRESQKKKYVRRMVALDVCGMDGTAHSPLKQGYGG